jgi:hypothetical protein
MKHRLSKQKPGKIQILPHFLSLQSPEIRAITISTMEEEQEERAQPKLSWQTIGTGVLCLLGQPWSSKGPRAMDERERR